MGLGGTAKRIQALAERAEQLYEQLVALRERTIKLEESVDESTARIQRLEVESEKQQVLLRAIAEERGIDVDRVLAEAAIEEAEPVEASESDDGAGADEEEGGTGESGAGGGGSSVEGASDADADETATGAADPGEADDLDDEPTVIDSSGEPVE